jgi:hypothetical protein
MIQNICAQYNFPIEGMLTTQEQLPILLEELESKYAIQKYSFNSSFTNQHHIIESVNKEFMIVIRSGVKQILIGDIYCNSLSLGQELFGIFKKYEDVSSTTNIKIISYSLSLSGQLEKSTTTKNQEDFKTLSKSYYPFLDTDELFKQYLISNDNLLLLAGDSGTGKTKILDMILNFCLDNENLVSFEDEDEEENILVAYVKNPQILALDAFWNQLTKASYHFIILDDLDHMLIDRNISVDTHDDTRNKFISNFLSFTDGIFKTDTKFIITTNQGVDNIDSAILRKGRCFDVLSFRSLTHNEAKLIWLEGDLDEEDFNNEFTNIHHINAADLGAKIEMRKNLKSINTTIKQSYLKEPGISLYSRNLSLNKISI